MHGIGNIDIIKSLDSFQNCTDLKMALIWHLVLGAELGRKMAKKGTGFY